MSTHTFIIVIVCFASIALADDFKTTNGKEYKNATVSRVEADGIILRTTGGVSKVCFSELPKADQERFHYNPPQAVAAQRQREQLALPAKQESALQAADRGRQEERTVAAATFNLFIPALVIAILIITIMAVVTVVRAKQRREQRAALFKQARDWAPTAQQSHA
jgi:hypothetical protein